MITAKTGFFKATSSQIAQQKLSKLGRFLNQKYFCYLANGIAFIASDVPFENLI
jgi:hypothetical protein